jgi:hypothetical protein
MSTVQPNLIAEHSGKLESVLTFARSARDILLHPRRFFGAVLSSPDAPPAGVLPPFKHLGMAIGLATLALPLHQALLRVGGFPERLLALANRSPQEMVSDFEEMTGRHIAMIDLSSLTGFSLIDEPIADAVQFATFALLATIIALWSGWRLKVKPLITYFAYVFGAILALQIVTNFAGDLLFLSLSGGWESRVQQSSIVSTIVGLVSLGYIFVVPVVVLPGLLNVPRRIVLRGIVLGGLTWGVGGLLLSYMMMGMGIIVRGPGL